MKLGNLELSTKAKDLERVKRINWTLYVFAEAFTFNETNFAQ